MKLMDSLKKATGLGLSHAEHYARAFEKGVLLGPPKYAEAIQLFEAAARKASEMGDSETQSRAIANARLYGFVTTGRPEFLPDLRQALEQIPQIEVIGSQTEYIPTNILKTEIEGRLIEYGILSVSENDHAQRAVAHQRAADTFRQIFQHPLITYRFQQTDPHTASAQARYFFNQGQSSWHRALHVVLTDPESAAEEMGKALAAFRQCQDDPWSNRAQNWLSGCRQKRTCWLCHRECQGASVHFESYSAEVTPYVVALVAKLGQDASSIDLGNGQIILCRTCSSGVEKIADRCADRHASKVRAEVMTSLGALAQAIDSINERLRSVEMRALIRS